MLGEDILVAPILEEGAVTRDIYLPAGTWEDGNTGEIYEAFVLCAIYVTVESKPLILDKLGETLTGVTCTVTGMILDKLGETLTGVTCTVTGILRKCSSSEEQTAQPGILRKCSSSEEQTAQPVTAINAGDGTAIAEPETATQRRIIQAGSCQAGYRMDRTGTCRRVA
ncbi:hypothetical protein QE152_g31004 [Popillia japonica]|uniref:Glycosyl hydrolase family 31 C-terminal domain-containing protein n=1 Tax=Popillia japonica TaxID=7064 RepID=A0AAW1JD42_POPJA